MEILKEKVKKEEKGINNLYKKKTNERERK